MPRKKTEATKIATNTTVTTTKAIADSVGSASIAGGGNFDTLSTVASQSLDRALTPAQAYELSSTFRRAVNVIADNEAKATLRFFSRDSGQEIESGDLVELFKRPTRNTSTFRFISDTVKFYKISGEIAWLPLYLNNASKGATPKGLKVLNPLKLQAYPANVRSLDFVTHWTYYDGMAIDNRSVMLDIPAERLLFARNFNPHSELRGLSEAITLVNEISSNYYTERFNVSFFKNGTVGDLIFRFPKGTKKNVVEDFVERWQEQHSIYNDNGFRIAVVVGDEMQVESPTQQPRDGQFLNLSTYNDEKIASLMGVPASIMGFYSKTRFDTIDAEVEAFAENTLLPDLKNYTEIIQHQIVDRYFPNAAATQKKTAKLGKLGRDAFERAMDENRQSKVVALLDPDTLPILARLNKAKVEHAKMLREALDLSANEAAEWVGIELEPNPVRSQVWVPNNRMRIDGNAQNEAQQEIDQLKKTVAILERTIADEAVLKAKEAEQQQPLDREKLDRLHDFYRSFRSMTLAELAQGKWIDKSLLMAQAKELDNDRLTVQLHRDYLALRAIHRSGSDVDTVLKEAKSYFNKVSRPAALRLLVTGES